MNEYQCEGCERWVEVRPGKINRDSQRLPYCTQCIPILTVQPVELFIRLCKLQDAGDLVTDENGWIKWWGLVPKLVSLKFGFDTHPTSRLMKQQKVYYSRALARCEELDYLQRLDSDYRPVELGRRTSWVKLNPEAVAMANGNEK